MLSNNISSFDLLLLNISTDTIYINSVMVLTAGFTNSSHTITIAGYNESRTYIYGSCQWLSDTSVKMKVSESGYNVTLYGIKL